MIPQKLFSLIIDQSTGKRNIVYIVKDLHALRDSIEPLLRPYEDNGLEMYEVSEDVNSTRNNDEHLIYALSE